MDYHNTSSSDNVVIFCDKKKAYKSSIGRYGSGWTEDITKAKLFKRYMAELIIKTAIINTTFKIVEFFVESADNVSETDTVKEDLEDPGLEW